MHRAIVPKHAPESKLALFTAGIVSGAASIVTERKTRRTELALYAFPRALDAAISIGRRRRWVPGPPLGSLALENALIWCSSMALVTYCFFHQPHCVSSLVFTALKYVTGVDPVKMLARYDRYYGNAQHGNHGGAQDKDKTGEQQQNKLEIRSYV
jgi:hypothetical protein